MEVRAALQSCCGRLQEIRCIEQVLQSKFVTGTFYVVQSCCQSPALEGLRGMILLNMCVFPSRFIGAFCRSDAATSQWWGREALVSAVFGAVRFVARQVC